METVELRPMSLGELLDRTFSLYRKHFWLLVGIMAVPAAFSIPLNFLVLTLQGNTFAVGQPPVFPRPQLIATILIAGLIFFVLLVVVYSIAAAAITHAVSEAYLGRNSTIHKSYGAIQGRFWRLIGVVLNIMLRMMGMFFLVFSVCGLGIGAIAMLGSGVSRGALPGGPFLAFGLAFVVILGYLAGIAWCFYFALRYAIAVPAMLVENLDVLTSIRRSVQLTRGRRGQIFVAFLLAAVIGGVGSMIFQTPFTVATMFSMVRNHQIPAWLSLMSSVSGALGGAITGPIAMIVLVLCYYDTRIRKEAFDLQFMMSSLGNPAAAPPAIHPA